MENLLDNLSWWLGYWGAVKTKSKGDSSYSYVNGRFQQCATQIQNFIRDSRCGKSRRAKIADAIKRGIKSGRALQ